MKLILALLTLALTSHAATPSKVDADLKTYEDKVRGLNLSFDRLPAKPEDLHWALNKLAHMVEVDQYTRDQIHLPKEHHYTAEEEKAFWVKFGPAWQKVDQRNTADLKDLLKIYGWFNISKYGKEADNNAWLLVQHADFDHAFQVEILAKLEKLYPSKETSAKNYAYLFDRVASWSQNPSQRKPQRYGTQGSCIKGGGWEPDPMEDAVNVDKRRAEVGLNSMKDYTQMMVKYCP